MKKKHKERAFFCQSCGHQEAKWMGKCPACNEWNTLVEEKISSNSLNFNEKKEVATPITQVMGSNYERFTIGLEELDRVLGGGLVKGGVILIGGEPGAGKSTLLQMASLSMARQGHKVLYISGEESKEQMALNLGRLDAIHEKIFLLSETDLNSALDEAQRISPAVLILDSVQTVSSREIDSVSGSIGQIREVTAKLVQFAKSLGIPAFLVGHVTKDGQIAGPRLLEHMVDTVLYFEQSRSDQYRLLRSHKNRFGSTNEIGLFEMTNKGLQGISNASSFFLTERPENKPGSAIFCAMEGNRPLLVEIQALAVESFLGSPRRTCVGIDSTRCSVIAAVLEKHASLGLSRMDLFVSVAGGLAISEPALDLALALAIASSIRNLPLPYEMIALGELGLAGEIRSVNRLDDRLKEAHRLGFSKAILPQKETQKISNDHGLKIRGASDIKTAISLLLAK